MSEQVTFASAQAKKEAYSSEALQLPAGALAEPSMVLASERSKQKVSCQLLFSSARCLVGQPRMTQATCAALHAQKKAKQSRCPFESAALLVEPVCRVDTQEPLPAPLAGVWVCGGLREKREIAGPQTQSTAISSTHDLIL